MDNRIGITTTIPIEAVYAADMVPVDLNNIFIKRAHSADLIEEAEKAGFPRAYCAWIKGIYGVIKQEGIKKVIGVMRGDCSDTHALCEILENEGIEVIPFSYPEKPEPYAVKIEIKKLCAALGTTFDKAEEMKKEFDDIRKLIIEIDKSAYENNNVTGFELFDFQINSSDFKGNPEKYLTGLEKFLEDIKDRKPFKKAIRLGLVGIPPAFLNIIEVLEERGAAMVFEQVPRQFSLPYTGENIAESYARYTYPYEFRYQLEDIKKESAIRKLDGIIHYIQSFCHRQLYDRMLRDNLEIPVLSIEGDRPSEVDGRTLTRIEAFIETLIYRDCNEK